MQPGQVGGDGRGAESLHPVEIDKAVVPERGQGCVDDGVVLLLDVSILARTIKTYLRAMVKRLPDKCPNSRASWA